MSPLVSGMSLAQRHLASLCVLILLFLGFSASAFGQHGARTIPQALDQLTDEAHDIVHGYIRSVRVEPHPQLRNLNTIVVTLSVKDTYKGTPRKSLVFRQYVWDLDPWHASTEYGKGQEVVLLLGPVSEYGLTSPVGLEQRSLPRHHQQKRPGGSRQREKQFGIVRFGGSAGEVKGVAALRTYPGGNRTKLSRDRCL